MKQGALWTGALGIAICITLGLFALTLELSGPAGHGADEGFGLPVTLEAAHVEGKPEERTAMTPLMPEAASHPPTVTMPVPEFDPVPGGDIPAPEIQDIHAAFDPSSVPMPQVSVSLPSVPRVAAPGDGVWDPEDVDQPSVLVRKVSPVYPFSALRKQITGEVSLRLVVDSEGRVSDVAVLSSSPPGVFDRAAVQAVRQWRFSPARISGKAVATRFVQTISFRLEEE